MHRFNPDTLLEAGVAELVDARDLKSLDPKGRAGSIPAFGMIFTRRSPAKVNLFLDITGKRKDGYHELASFFLTVSLFDTLTVSISEHFSLEMSVQIPGANQATLVQLQSDNILEKVFTYFKEIYQISNLKIKLDKKIPIGAGLGGGSSNAATLILLINEIFKLDLPQPKLMEIAAIFGSDIPFFILGGLAKVSGRGEFVLPMNFFPNLYLVLIHPGVSISTKMAYQELVTFSSEDKCFEDYEKSLETLSQTASLENLKQLATFARNGFEAKAAKMFLEVNKALEVLKPHTPYQLLSGSGSVVFGVFVDAEAAAAAVSNIKKVFPWTISVHSQKAGEFHEDH